MGNDVAANGFAQVDEAHTALRADPSIQFNLTPPDPPPGLPDWLRAFFRWLGDLLEPVGKLLAWIGSIMPEAPFARFLLWAVLATAAVALAWVLYNRLKHGEWWLKLPRLSARDLDYEEEWTPEEALALSWLEEADSLAGEGRYAEAIHYLLLRSIDDIATRRPNLVRPALTSRELAASSAIPAPARARFGSIARLVERSLFGGRLIGESDWTEARDAYRELELAGSWRG